MNTYIRMFLLPFQSLQVHLIFFLQRTVCLLNPCPSHSTNNSSTKLNNQSINFEALFRRLALPWRRQKAHTDISGWHTRTSTMLV